MASLATSEARPFQDLNIKAFCMLCGKLYYQSVLKEVSVWRWVEVFGPDIQAFWRSFYKPPIDVYGRFTVEARLRGCTYGQTCGTPKWELGGDVISVG